MEVMRSLSGFEHSPVSDSALIPRRQIIKSPISSDDDDDTVVEGE